MMTLIVNFKQKERYWQTNTYGQGNSVVIIRHPDPTPAGTGMPMMYGVS